jgi:hypothetical protein
MQCHHFRPRSPGSCGRVKAAVLLLLVIPEQTVDAGPCHIWDSMAPKLCPWRSSTVGICPLDISCFRFLVVKPKRNHLTTAPWQCLTYVDFRRNANDYAAMMCYQR